MTTDITGLLERFLRYVQIDTRSDDQSPTTPSTPGQWNLLRLLQAELQALGLTDIVPQRDHLTALLGSAQLTAVIAALVHDDVPVRAFGPVPVNLEDVFVTLTGEGFGVSG